LNLNDFNNQTDTKIIESLKNYKNYIPSDAISSKLNKNDDYISSTVDKEYVLGLKNLKKIINNTNAELDNYSRIRNNIAKLQNSEKNNSYLPENVVTSFLGNLQNIDIHGYLNEELKKSKHYRLSKISSISTNINNGYNDYDKKIKKRKFNTRFKKLNSPTYNNKSSIINEFQIYHKRLKRPGLELKNKYNRFNLEPFVSHADNQSILNRGIIYGLGDFVYKNNSVTRRTDDLMIRTFGPNIRTNSPLWGYGRLDKSLDFSVNSEEDYNIFNGLGYPEIVEQNVYDETN
jgi:hypothetical protein